MRSQRCRLTLVLLDSLKEIWCLPLLEGVNHHLQLFHRTVCVSGERNITQMGRHRDSVFHIEIGVCLSREHCLSLPIRKGKYILFDCLGNWLKTEWAESLNIKVKYVCTSCNHRWSLYSNASIVEHLIECTIAHILLTIPHILSNA